MLLISRLPKALHNNHQLSPPPLLQDPVLDQFQQMRSMISSFLGARQDSTPSLRQSFCNYLHSEIEHLEERDFLTFRNETVKLHSEIQYKAEEHKRQVTTTQQVTTFQLLEATQAIAGCEYILTIPDTQPVSVPVVQPSQIATTQPATVIAKLQQPSRPSSALAQPTSFLVVDDQQPGISRQLMFTLSPAKTVYPPSVASGQQDIVYERGKSTQHFWIAKPLWWDSKCTTVPADRHSTTIFTLSTSISTITSAIFHSSRIVKTSQPVQSAESAQISRSACIKSHQLATQIFQK